MSKNKDKINWTFYISLLFEGLYKHLEKLFLWISLSVVSLIGFLVSYSFSIGGKTLTPRNRINGVIYDFMFFGGLAIVYTLLVILEIIWPTWPPISHRWNLLFLTTCTLVFLTMLALSYWVDKHHKH